MLPAPDNKPEQWQQLGESYEVAPRPGVWPRIEEALEQRKKRRLALWWWLPLAVALVVGVGWWASGVVVEEDKPARTTGSDGAEVKAKAEVKDKPARTTGSDGVKVEVEDRPARMTGSDGVEDEAKAKPARMTGSDGVKDEPARTTGRDGVKAKPARMAGLNVAKTEVAVKSAGDKGRGAKAAAGQRAGATAPADARAVAKGANWKAKMAPVREATPNDSGTDADPVVQHQSLSAAAKASAAARPVAISKPRPKQTLLPPTEMAQSTAVHKDTPAVPTTAQHDAWPNATDAPANKTVDALNTPSATAEKPLQALVDTPMQDKPPSHLHTAHAGDSTAGKLKIGKLPPVRWHAVVGLGVGLVGERNALLGNIAGTEKAFESLGNIGNTIGGTGNQFATGAAAENRAGVAMLVGVRRTQALGTRWQWQASAAYGLVQTRQAVGQRRDSGLSVGMARANYFYTPGNATYTASQHSVVLSSGMAFRLLGRRNTLWMEAHPFVGVQVFSNLLIPYQTRGSLIPGKSQYNTLSGGLLWGLNWQTQAGWQLGINHRASFTAAYKPLNGQRQYWQALMLSCYLPLLKH